MLKQLIFTSLLLSFNSYAETNSLKFKHFDTDSTERQLFVKEQNGRVNQRLKSSKNFKKIEKDFLDFGKAAKKKEIVGTNKKTYTLFDRGLGKPQELVEKNLDGSTRIIFSSFSLAKNNNYNLLNFKLNPGENKVILTASFKGSIDGYMLLTVDMETGTILHRSEERTFGASSFIFYDDNSIVAYSKTAKAIIAISILDGSLAKVILGNVLDYEAGADFFHAYTAEEHNVIIAGDKIYDLGKMGDIEIIVKKDNILLLKRLVIVDKKEIVSVLSIDLDLSLVTKIMELDGEPTTIHTFEKNLIVENLEGLKRELTLYDFKGKKISNLLIPFCCQIADLEIEDDTETQIANKVKVTLKSPVKNQSFEWSLENQNVVIPESTVSSILESSEFSITVEAKSVKSFDGTVIPYLMVYKKGLAPVNAPVYLDVYGGFSYKDDMVNVFDGFTKKFIQRGGVFIAPGVRGGSVYGEAWHKAAMKENKYKTFEDVASVAKDLIESNVSLREKIAIAGSSNGGLTVAATGLMFPQYFGLVIPHNGVLDMLSKETLDARFDNGWSREYGDSRIEENFKFISKYSPVERVTVAKELPRFLVINGRTDTRVNAAHSIKFAAAAKSAGVDSVELISINNSGHFNLSMHYSDFIAWRTQVVKWTTIYDVMGMEY